MRGTCLALWCRDSDALIGGAEIQYWHLCVIRSKGSALTSVKLTFKSLTCLCLQAAERGGDFIEVISQSGGKTRPYSCVRVVIWMIMEPYSHPFILSERETSQPADAHLTPTSPGSAPPSSPLSMALSPVTSPCPFLTHARSELQAWMDDTDEQRCPCGRLEDSLRSTDGETLLGVEPYGLLSLIDGIHSQMCFPGSPSPGDAFSTRTEEEHELDLTVWEVKCEDNSTLGPLVPQPPSSVFSTDFLDSFDMQMLSV